MLDTAREDEDDDDAENGEYDEDDAKRCVVAKGRKPQVLSIRDVEESMQTFSGDDTIIVDD